MQPFRRTRDTLQTYVGRVFQAPQDEVRRSLEVGDPGALEVTVSRLVDGLVEITGLTRTVIYRLLGTSQPTISREKNTGSPVTLDAADRAFQTTEIVARAAAMIGEENARSWIAKPNSHLDGRAPLELMLTSTGRERLSRYLDSLEDVTYG